VGEGPLGKAVHAAQGFRKGNRIARFSGPHVSADRLPATMVGRLDRLVQVSADWYMGPSGAVDLISLVARPMPHCD
jgi:hypothetical protein